MFCVPKSMQSWLPTKFSVAHATFYWFSSVCLSPTPFWHVAFTKAFRLEKIEN
jgi:hypothetical protein